MTWTPQLVRVVIAGVLAALFAISVTILAAMSKPIPDALMGGSIATLTYLFGVVTNGSGITGRGGGAGGNGAPKP